MSKYLNITNGERDTKFPIYHKELWAYFKQQQHAIWTAEEIDLSKDTLEGIPEKSISILKNLLAFFGVSDTIVQDNLADEIVRARLGFKNLLLTVSGILLMSMLGVVLTILTQFP